MYKKRKRKLYHTTKSAKEASRHSKWTTQTVNDGKRTMSTLKMKSHGYCQNIQSKCNWETVSKIQQHTTIFAKNRIPLPENGGTEPGRKTHISYASLRLKQDLMSSRISLNMKSNAYRHIIILHISFYRINLQASMLKFHPKSVYKTRKWQPKIKMTH